VWWSGLAKPNGLRSPVARTILLEHALTSSGDERDAIAEPVLR
jgi:hypothetical protein